MVRIRYASGTHMVRGWYTYGTQVVRIRYAIYSTGTQQIRTWYAYGTHDYGTQLVRSWYAFGTQLVRMRTNCVPTAYQIFGTQWYAVVRSGTQLVHSFSGLTGLRTMPISVRMVRMVRAGMHGAVC